MWRSPIQICGTVRRPLFFIISARRSGSRSTRIFSMAAPLATRSRSADWQNGHAAVAYITTFAILLLHRQPGLLPGTQPAGQIHGALQALLFHERDRFAGALAGIAVDDDRAVLALRDL